MRHTTHNLPLEQKEALFHKHKELIFMIYSFGGYMLRKQIRRLFHLLTNKSEADIEFDIAELICSGFLLQKSINKDTRTQMLYLSKFPKLTNFFCLRNMLQPKLQLPQQQPEAFV